MAAATVELAHELDPMEALGMQQAFHEVHADENEDCGRHETKRCEEGHNRDHRHACIRSNHSPDCAEDLSEEDFGELRVSER